MKLTSTSTFVSEVSIVWRGPQLFIEHYRERIIGKQASNSYVLWYPHGTAIVVAFNKTIVWSAMGNNCLTSTRYITAATNTIQGTLKLIIKNIYFTLCIRTRFTNTKTYIHYRFLFLVTPVCFWGGDWRKKSCHS